MTNGKVYALAHAGSTVYVGGEFSQLLNSANGGASARANLAAINASTGAAVTTFTPSVTLPGGKPSIRALAVSPDGSTLYLGGKFTRVNGVAVSHLAAINLATGQVVAGFRPKVTGQWVHTILPTASRIYFGGQFSTVAGVARSSVAAVTPTGALDAWAPRPNGIVRSLVFGPGNSTIFVGGRFSSVSGQPREAVARVSATSGAVDPWAIPNGTIEDGMITWSLTVRGTTLYGGFGEGPNYAAAFRLDFGTIGLRKWRFNTVGNVQSVALDPLGSRLLIAGHFGTAQLQQPTSCGGTPLKGLASLNPLTGSLNCDWLPQLAPSGNNYIGAWTLLVNGAHVWTGGMFNTVDGDTQRNVARFPL